MTQVVDTAMPAAPVERDRTRPLGIVLLVLFQFLNLTVNLLALGGVLGPRTGTLVAVLGNDIPVLTYLQVGFAALSLVGVVGLWLLKRFGWYLVMLLTGLGLAIQIIFYVWATPNFVNLTIFVVSAFYLNQHEVKSIFLQPHRDQATVVLAAEEDDGP